MKVAIAIEKLKAVRVHGNDLRQFCIDHPEAGKDILEHLASSVSGRFQDASAQVHSILKNGMKKN